MHIDKKLMHRIFVLIAGCIVFAWLVLDTRAEETEYAHHPFAVGCGRETQMDGDGFHDADIIARFSPQMRRFQNSEESLAG